MQTRWEREWNASRSGDNSVDNRRRPREERERHPGRDQSLIQRPALPQAAFDAGGIARAAAPNQAPLGANEPGRSETCEYCFADRQQRLHHRIVYACETHRQHTAQRVPPDASAAWLHHRFVQIHPFQDGNGRLAEAISSLVLIQAR